MNVFELRRRVVDDYSGYVRSFIRVLAPCISTAVNAELSGGLLWPEPLIELNPSFEPGEYVDELVARGVLHKGCDDVFRRDKSDSDRRGSGSGCTAIRLTPSFGPSRAGTHSHSCRRW